MDFRGVRYYVKKGIMLLADEFESYLLTDAVASKNPLSMQTGMIVSKKNEKIRDALYNRSDLEYLDKKIQQECKDRVKRQEYFGMSKEERERVDAIWRQKRWKEEGLDAKRQKLGIDSSIDKKEPQFEKFVMKNKKSSTKTTVVVNSRNANCVER